MKRNDRIVRGTRLANASMNVAAFTLIELMVVMALITVFSALVVPSVVNAMRSGTLRDDGTKLCELLRFASVYAVTQHHPVQLNIDEQKGRCWVSVSTTNLPWEENQPKQKTRVLSEFRVSENNRVQLNFDTDSRDSAGGSGKWTAITFASDGHAQDAVVQLTNNAGETYPIEINGSTGQVAERDETK